MAEEAGNRQTPGGNGAAPAPAVFRGVTQLVLDAKGRLAVPAKHRDALAPAGDGKVVLTGNVHSWFEREEARRAAWAAPGVMAVDDRLVVVP